MWTSHDLNKIHADVSIIYSSIMKGAITEHDDSYIIDLESAISIPTDIADNMQLYAAASEILEMCVAEYKNATHNICVEWAHGIVRIRAIIGLMDAFEKAVQEQHEVTVAEKATVFAMLILRKNN